MRSACLPVGVPAVADASVEGRSADSTEEQSPEGGLTPRSGTPTGFFGDALSAADAERMDLVNRTVPGRELETLAKEWAGRLTQGPTRAVALTKQLVNASLDGDRAAAFAAEAAAQEINMTTRDANEGVASFVERRTPEYRGY